MLKSYYALVLAIALVMLRILWSECRHRDWMQLLLDREYRSADSLPSARRARSTPHSGRCP